MLIPLILLSIEKPCVKVERASETKMYHHINCPHPPPSHLATNSVGRRKLPSLPPVDKHVLINESASWEFSCIFPLFLYSQMREFSQDPCT